MVAMEEKEEEKEKDEEVVISGGGDARPCPLACRGCARSVESRGPPLVCYSAFTKRIVESADELLLACKDERDGETRVIRVVRVPYRFYLKESDRDRLRKDIVDGATRRRGGYVVQRCLRTADDDHEAKRLPFLKVTVFNRDAYQTCFENLSADASGTDATGPYTDCCHFFCHHSEALANSGIRGAHSRLTIPAKKCGGEEVDEAAATTLEDPSAICCHDLAGDEDSDRGRSTADLLKKVAFLTMGDDGGGGGGSGGPSLRVAREDNDREEEETEYSNAEAFCGAMRDLRADVLFVRDLSKTLQRLDDLLGGDRIARDALFTKRTDCRPTFSSPTGGVVGLGVLVFDLEAADEEEVRLAARRCATAKQLLECARSNGVLENHLTEVARCRTNSAAVCKRDGDGYGPTAFDTFSCTMALEYQRRGMVTCHDARHAVAYRGGYVKRPWACFATETPVVEMDFFSMYPSIALAFNVSKETYAADGGFRARPRNNTLRAAIESAVDRKRKLEEEAEKKKKINSGDATPPDVRREIRACKRFANNMCGMLGNGQCPYSDRRVAGCITAMGRRLLLACESRLSSSSRTTTTPSRSVLAAYTDSLLVRIAIAVGPTPTPTPTPTPPNKKKTNVAVADLATAVRRAGEELAAVCRVAIADVAASSLKASPNVAAAATAAATLLKASPKNASFASLFSGKAHKYARLLLLSSSPSETPHRVLLQSATVTKGFGPRRSDGGVDYFEERVLVRVALKGFHLVQTDEEGRRFDAWDVERLARESPARVFLPECGGWTTIATCERCDEDDDEDGECGVIAFALEECEEAGGRRAVRRYVRDIDDRLLVEADSLVVVVAADELASLRRRRVAAAREAARCFFLQLMDSGLPLDAYVHNGEFVLARDGNRYSLETFCSSADPNVAIDLAKRRDSLAEKLLDEVACGACGKPFSTERPLHFAVPRGSAAMERSGELAVTAAAAAATASRGESILPRHPECIDPEKDDAALGKLVLELLPTHQWIGTLLPRAKCFSAVFLSAYLENGEDLTERGVPALSEFAAAVKGIEEEEKKESESLLVLRHRPPERAFSEVLTELEKALEKDETLCGERSRVWDERAVAALPLPEGGFLSLHRRGGGKSNGKKPSGGSSPLTSPVADLMREAVLAEKCDHFDGAKLLAACEKYPCDWLYHCPPPVLTEDRLAPVASWQRVMSERSLPKGGGSRYFSRDDYEETTTTTRTELCVCCGMMLCSATFRRCGRNARHFVCRLCSVVLLVDDRCPSCDEPYINVDGGDDGDGDAPPPPRLVNYHPAHFPFERLYRKTLHGFLAFSGTLDKFVAQESSFRRIVRLAHGYIDD